MQGIFQPLQDNLQLIYRKAIDADQALSQLQQTGKGKHKAIFSKEAGFSASSTRFAPYVAELAEQIQQLQQQDEASVKQALPGVVKKIELLLVTLQQFRGSLT